MVHVSLRRAYVPAIAVLTVFVTASVHARGTEGERSYLARLWDLEESSAVRWGLLAPHRPVYVLPFTRWTAPTPPPAGEPEPKRVEAAFQLSFKIKLAEDIFKGPADLWLGYTQRSFWQVYDRANSAPFRGNDYEPELLVSWPVRYRLLGWTGRFVCAGINHQSNGRSGDLSRSWNRLVAETGLERGAFSVLLRGWARVLYRPGRSDNPGITRYLGYGEIKIYGFHKRHRLGLMVRDNLRFSGNRGAVELEWSLPVAGRLAAFVQAFFGYGESLIDFDRRVSRIGVGIIFPDWY